MTGVIWRLHKNQAVFAVATLAGLVVLLSVTGSRMLSDYHSALSNCGLTGGCSDIRGTLYHGDGFIIDLVELTLVVPLLFGLFWGAPLVAKELEDGTNAFAWTQAVTRRRWLVSNIGWVVLAAIVWGGVMSAIVTWWRYPENALSGRFNTFDIQGFVPIAYSLFAVALGIAVGSILRRVLASLAITLGLFVGVRAAIGFYLRPHYIAPLAKLYSMARGGGPSVSAWLLSTQIVARNGQVVPSLFRAEAACAQRGVLSRLLLTCMQARGYRIRAIYQPDSRFWTFQGIESGIFVVLAIGLLALAYWRVLASDA